MEGKRKRLDSETVQQIEDWIMSGEWSLGDISRKFNVPYNTLWAVARRLGVSPPKKTTAAEIEEAFSGSEDDEAKDDKYPSNEYNAGSAMYDDADKTEDDNETEEKDTCDQYEDENIEQKDEAANIKALCRSIGEVFIAISNM